MLAAAFMEENSLGVAVLFGKFITFSHAKAILLTQDFATVDLLLLTARYCAVHMKNNFVTVCF